MPPIKLSKITFPPPKKKPTPNSDVSVQIPSELVEKVWNAIEVVPGLTLETALTMALQQFLRTLPSDYEREDT